MTLAAILLMALTACSGGDERAEPSSTTAASETETTSVPATAETPDTTGGEFELCAFWFENDTPNRLTGCIDDDGSVLGVLSQACMSPNTHMYILVADRDAELPDYRDAWGWPGSPLEQGPLPDDIVSLC